jgi:CyaY protein
MTDQEYFDAIEACFRQVESMVDEQDQDLDARRNGSVLEVEMNRKDKIIINSQEPLHELWLASKFGAHHFKFEPHSKAWLDTRSQQEFYTLLRDHLSRFS